jgi:hypothetical protein
MTTSVAVFSPGFRVTDANDLPVSGAVIEFYAAGTTTPKTVYSDRDLTVAIGTTVTCDSGGYPASGGNRVLVYVNESAYKIIGKTSAGTTLWEHDDVLGAIEPGSGSGGSETADTFGFKVGMVALTLTSSPEAGWVRLTDATQALVKADYPDLNSWASAQGYPWGSASTTFNIPPAGGYFLRFGSSGSTIDPSGPRSPGSTQTDAMQGHRHSHNLSSPASQASGGVAGIGSSGNLGTTVAVTLVIGDPITDGTNGTPRTATETRGKNVAMYADMLAVPALVASGLVGAVGPAYQWNSSTAGSDVTTGRLALNNATLASATSFYISETSYNGSALATFLQSIPSGSKVYITKVGTPATFIAFTLSSTATDAGSYDSFTITSVSSGGTLSNGDTVSVVFMPAGTTGSNGSNGSNGTDPGIRWLFASSTTMADPSAGNVRLNNATLASVTAIAVHYSSGETGNPSVSSFVQSWDDSSSTTNRGHLVIKKASAPQNFVILNITSAITDNTTWGQFTVAYIGGSGSFSAADTLSVQFYRTGNAGTGIGDLLAANNLSDVSAKYTSFDNLSVRGADIASASTINLTTATGNLVDVTGTTTITAITLSDGYERTVRFTGILTLTHGASLVLPSGASITTAAGDFAVFRGYAAGVVRCVAYTRADGTAVGSSGASAGTGLVSASGSLYVQQLQPGGRLTLTSGTPVLTTDAAAQTTIYYAPFVHGFIPVYNGTDMRLYSILSSATDAVGLSLAMAGSANWASGSVYDLFYAYVSGVLYFGTGPAWSSTTARGTGAGTTELQRYNGLWTNKVSMTLRNAAGTQTVPANQGTLLGSFYASANGTTTIEFGGIAASGAAAKMYLANQYNRQQWVGFIGDSTDSWTYNSVTVRAANGSTTMRANYLASTNEFFVDGMYTIQCETNASNGITTGMDQDSTTTFGDCANFHSANSIRSIDVSAASWPAGLGVHYISANEVCPNTSAAVTVYGDNGTPASRQGGLTVKGWF